MTADVRSPDGRWRDLRQNVEDLLTRVLAGGEIDLAPRLIHPAFVNNEASPEHRHGPEGAAATSEWLRSCFGDLKYEIHHIFVDDRMTAAYGRRAFGGPRRPRHGHAARTAPA
jgi:hypothetical protein